MDDIWYVLYVNPEPWAVGSISVGSKGARMSPNPNLVAFQNAVREDLKGRGEELLPSEYRRFEFYFFRQTAVYLDSLDRRRSRNQADATNGGIAPAAAIGPRGNRADKEQYKDDQ